MKNILHCKKIKETIIEYFKDINTPKVHPFDILIEMGLVSKNYAILNYCNKDDSCTYNVDYYRRRGYSITNSNLPYPPSLYSSCGKNHWDISIININKGNYIDDFNCFKEYSKYGLYVFLNGKFSDYELEIIRKEFGETELLFRGRFKNIIKIIY